MTRTRRPIQSILNLVSDAFSFSGGMGVLQLSVLRALGQMGDSCPQIASLHLMDAERDIWEGRRRLGIRDDFLIRGFDGQRARFALAAMWFILARRPDVVICGHVNLAVVPYLARKLGGPTYCVWLYYYDILGAHHSLRRRALVQADFCVGISEFAAKIARREFPELKDVRTCLLGLPEEAAGGQGLLAPPPAFRQRRVVLIVARIPTEISKGHRLLMAALRKVREAVPNVLLCVVGRGADEAALREYAVECGISDAVHWAGFVAEEDLPRYFAHCDVFAMPSDAEGFGLVYVAAMLHRKPCIGGTDGAAPEIIQHGRTGFLVSKDDASRLSTFLICLLNRDEARLRFGEAGYRRAKDLFVFSRFRERLVGALGLTVVQRLEN